NRMIALSPNSNITVILDSLEGLSLSNYNVFPFSEAEINDGVSGSFLKDTSTYQSDEFYPFEKWMRDIPSIWQGLRVTVLGIRPFSYNPVSGELRIKRRMTVHCQFEGFDDKNTIPDWPLYVEPTSYKMFQNIVLNFQSLQILPNSSSSTHYIIILGNNTPELRDSVEFLREWKMKKGYITYLLRIPDDIPRDTTAIKNWIRQFYYAHPGDLIFILLVGDHTEIPLARGWVTISSDTIYSDHWYACVHGEDDLADVDIGRIPTVNPHIVAEVARKIYRFETFSLPWERNRVLVIPGGLPPSTYYTYKTEYIYHWTLEPLGVPTSYLNCPYPEEIKFYIQDPFLGGGLVNWLGDGEFTEETCRWKWPHKDPPHSYQYFTNEDILSLTNFHYPPIVFEMASYCGKINHPQIEGHSEVWIEHTGGGAVAALGPTIFLGGRALAWLDTILFRTAYLERNYLLGPCIREAKIKYLSTGYRGANKAFHLMGDPSLSIWIEDNYDLNATCEVIRRLGSVLIRVTVTDWRNRPVPDAVVSIYKENEPHPYCLYIGKTNDRGIVEIEAWFTITGNAELTVTKPLYYPYEAVITVPAVPPWLLPPISCDRATYPNSGRLLTVNFQTGDIHTVCDTGSHIVYLLSKDKGENWFPFEVDVGSYPSITLDKFGKPRIVFLKNDTIFCRTLQDDNTWHTVVVFGVKDNLRPGPPIIAPTFQKGLDEYSYCVFPVKNLSENTSKICLSIFNVNEDTGGEIKEVASGENLESPSIAVTPGDIIHIVWEKDGEIYYRSGKKDSIGELSWSEIYNLSESPAVISKNPVIEAYGENVICAWKEGEPGEIYRRVRNLAASSLPTWPPGWSGIENLSQSPNKESDYPVISTPNVCAWQEAIDSLNYEIIAWIKGFLVNLSETENSSKYPHIAVEPPTISDDGTLSPDVIINAIWTEEIIPNTLYGVRFKRYNYTSSPIANTPYLSPIIGETIPSTYCEQRDGVMNYGDFSCDYSSSSLIYNLPYLNPKASYLLRAVVYKETPRVWREEVYVDSQFITEVFYYPYIPETLNIILPKEAYENDLAIKKEIERITGSYALIADLKVYEVSVPESLQGGGQSLLSGKIKRTVLYQNQPNPFRNITQITFVLGKEGYVSLSIYDASGRKVRTIIQESLRAGGYSLRWDGKDDRGRGLPEGVYFYRLKTEDFREVKKTILLR
ncbi:MAG: C25 family cysteine peptidase, partial [candidate division WOR-3 bacterium]